MSIASTTLPSDAWGQNTAPGRAARIAQRKSQHVPDAWDDDNDEEEDQVELWHAANTKAPMPEVIISTSTTTSSVVSPPPAAIQPSLRILKRPSTSSSPAPSTPSPNLDQQQKSLAEREAQYQAARERIFGERTIVASSKPNGRLSTGTSTPPNIIAPTATATIIRNPRGPDPDAQNSSGHQSQVQGVSRGFVGRKGAKSREAVAPERSS